MRALRESKPVQLIGVRTRGSGARRDVAVAALTTNVPCPTWARACPAATSSSYASATVARLTPRLVASSRGGELDPIAEMPFADQALEMRLDLPGERDRLLAIERDVQGCHSVPFSMISRRRQAPIGMVELALD
jgi:hypothetical protein